MNAKGTFTKSMHMHAPFQNMLKKTGAKEADKYVQGSSLFYPRFNFEWCFRFITKEGFWCWWHYVVCPKVFAVMWFLKWLACIMKKKRKVHDPMGTSGSVTSLQLVQRDGLLQNTANHAFVPWTIYIIETYDFTLTAHLVSCWAWRWTPTHKITSILGKKKTKFKAVPWRSRKIFPETSNHWEIKYFAFIGWEPFETCYLLIWIDSLVVFPQKRSKPKQKTN